jgi:anti-sigma regulatory factor (Ser/Thr protein kinase)
MEPDQGSPRVVLERRPSEAQRARRAIAEVCDGLSRDTVSTAQLLASELFTNALDHGQGRITMQVRRVKGELCIEVSDESPDRPRIKTVTLDDTRGRGLIMLEALAERWGVVARPDGRGKAVWFALSTSQ